MLPFSGDPTLFAAVPEARREALLISAFQNDLHSSSALRTAMEWLPKFPYPAFANAIAARVESRKFELEYEKKIIAMRRANWNELEKNCRRASGARSSSRKRSAEQHHGGM